MFIYEIIYIMNIFCVNHVINVGSGNVGVLRLFDFATQV